jgi:hypothetical protein
MTPACPPAWLARMLAHNVDLNQICCRAHRTDSSGSDTMCFCIVNATIDTVRHCCDHVGWSGDGRPESDYYRTKWGDAFHH